MDTLLGESRRWSGIATRQVSERLSAVVQYVSAAAATIQVDLPGLLKPDLVALQSRPYLRDYFEALEVGDYANS